MEDLEVRRSNLKLLLSTSQREKRTRQGKSIQLTHSELLYH